MLLELRFRHRTSCRLYIDSGVKEPLLILSLARLTIEARSPCVASRASPRRKWSLESTPTWWTSVTSLGRPAESPNHLKHDWTAASAACFNVQGLARTLEEDGPFDLAPRRVHFLRSTSILWSLRAFGCSQVVLMAGTNDLPYPSRLSRVHHDFGIYQARGHAPPGIAGVFGECTCAANPYILSKHRLDHMPHTRPQIKAPAMMSPQASECCCQPPHPASSLPQAGRKGLSRRKQFQFLAFRKRLGPSEIVKVPVTPSRSLKQESWLLAVVLWASKVADLFDPPGTTVQQGLRPLGRISPVSSTWWAILRLFSSYQ